MIKRIPIALILTVCCFGASAQVSPDAEKDKQYVTDVLRLTLYDEPKSGANSIKVLTSGDLLIIDEIRGPYALVTSPDGTRGWVKRGFLVTNPTSNILLREEQEKSSSLYEEIEKLSNSKAVIETYEKDMDAMTQQLAAMEVEKQEAQTAIGELQLEVEATQQKLEQKLQNNLPPHIVLWETLRSYWKFILPLLLVLILISVFITKIAIEAHIKSKFHGIKIW